MLDKLVSKLKDRLSLSTGAVAAIESYLGGNINPEANIEKENLIATVESIATEMVELDKVQVSKEQIEAAKQIAIYAANPVATVESVLAKRDESLKANRDAIVVPAFEGYTTEEILNDVRNIVAAKEAFDGENLVNTLVFSIAWNINIKQDDVVELFFPLVVVDTNAGGLTYTQKIINTINVVKRDASGKPAKLERESIIKKLNDTSFFTLDANRIYPVYREVNKDKLLDVPGAKRNVEVMNGIEITTAPIRAGIKVDLLGISQTDELLANGYLDETDALDRHISLTRLYFKITGKDSDDNDVTEYHVKEISGLPAAFTYTPTGHNKDLQLDYTNNISWIGNKILTLDGKTTQIKALKDLPEGYTVNVRVNLKGSANAEEGNIKVTAFELELIDVRDAAGNKLPEDDEIYKNVADVFKTLEFVAYDVEAYVTNSNLRFKGKKIETSTLTYIYPVPVRTKFIEETSVIKNGDDGDTAGLLGQISLTTKALSKHGYVELKKIIATLETINGNPDAIVGPASQLFLPTLVKTNLEIDKKVNSLTNTDRSDNVRDAIRLHIKNLALRLYIDSGYNIAFETYNPGVKPTVIIGTDTTIGSFMSDWEDEVFNYVVKSTSDIEMSGKIIVSFGKVGGKGNELSPFNFGVCLWRPEITFTFERQNNNKIVNETITMPSFKHYGLNYILGVVSVTGIDKVLDELPFHVKSV